MEQAISKRKLMTITSCRVEEDEVASGRRLGQVHLLGNVVIKTGSARNIIS